MSIGENENTIKKPEELKYDANGLIPAIVQDVETGAVLMLAYMNEESVRRTLDTGLTWFWSRSRQKFWQKGESSGHVQEVKSMYYDCDADAILVKAKQNGVACHTGNYTCFFNCMKGEGAETYKNGCCAAK